jgi:3-deoxy-D-manno-octulosonic acid kinase
VVELPGDKSLDRYCAFQRGGERGFAVRQHHAEVIGALLDRRRCEPVAALGRGALFIVPLHPGKGVLREYRRGGVVGRFVREGTLTNRPLREWEVVDRLFNAGFPVPDPLGVVWNRRGLLYTGAIATQFVDTTNLAELLKGPAEPDASLLENVGRLVRRMHDLCVYHADLHVGNILVASDPASPHSVYFVDFDNARIAAVSQLGRARNLLRLRRSFLKRGLPMTDFECVLRGYGPISLPGWLETVYEIKGAVSDAIGRCSGTHAV